MNEFTKGEWKVLIEQVKLTSNAETYTVVTDNFDIVSCSQGIRNQEDAELIAASGVVANIIAEQGYDAIEVIKSLPHIMAYLEGQFEYQPEDTTCGRILEDCKGEE